jgi:hypothetical protein
MDPVARRHRRRVQTPCIADVQTARFVAQDAPGVGTGAPRGFLSPGRFAPGRDAAVGIREDLISSSLTPRLKLHVINSICASGRSATLALGSSLSSFRGAKRPSVLDFRGMQAQRIDVRSNA